MFIFCHVNIFSQLAGGGGQNQGRQLKAPLLNPPGPPGPNPGPGPNQGANLMPPQAVSVLQSLYSYV